jgi:hypothetical protein
MPIGTDITALSTTPASNQPPGTEARTTADDNFRQLAAFVAVLRDGSKNLELGSVSAPSIAFTGDANTGIYSPGANRLGLVTDGALRWEVDATGRLMNAANTQAGFSANLSAAISSLATDAAIIFDTEAYDSGTMYNNATGVATIPVTGTYAVTFNVGFSNGSGVGKQNYVGLYKNGTAIRQAIGVDQTSESNARVLMDFLRFTAGDLIKVAPTITAVTADNPIIGGSSGSHFSMRLVG